jgi:hypothetical protein
VHSAARFHTTVKTQTTSSSSDAFAGGKLSEKALVHHLSLFKVNNSMERAPRSKKSM